MTTEQGGSALEGARAGVSGSRAPGCAPPVPLPRGSGSAGPAGRFGRAPSRGGASLLGPREHCCGPPSGLEVPAAPTRAPAVRVARAHARRDVTARDAEPERGRAGPGRAAAARCSAPAGAACAAGRTSSAGRT
ncbi:hypothetical protein J0S82_001427 [Galemys pyrenaicus]|uniref:Uncharacterized protein n=1 Tax=Galemys pyrenaicus TaxID=202257 RepID=A0A8J6DI68_GALPY|nr:hypothetical protein J0S82_001427 [Galemys pyrenaicus]